MNALEINDLSFSYDNKVDAIHSIQLTIEAGKYVAIVGHNGSGKSTLAKLILGLLEKKEGKIIVFGQEVNEKNIDTIRQEIGIVFQNPDNQFVGSTVREDIAFGLENRCIPYEEMEARIHEFAKKVQMEEFLDKEPSNLSGGQKQRVAIAGVLAMHPKMIIFDEATAMLDPRGKKEIREVIEEMRKENPDLTILSITHDMEEASKADEVIILSHGTKVLQGSASEVLSHTDILQNLNLKLPFLSELYVELLENGVKLEEAHSFDEMVVNVCQYVLKK